MSKSFQEGKSSKVVCLRIIKSESKTPNSNKDVITGLSRNERNVGFQCSINLSDTFLEEHTDEENRIYMIRFRHLSNPPPPLPSMDYEHVRYVHISCVVPINWIFSIFAMMPKLKTVTFGTGCFSDENYDYRHDTKLMKCTTVKELRLTVDVERYKALEQGLPQVNLRIRAIFENIKMCFPCLQHIDFQLPIDIEKSLESFRNTLPQFQHTGNESKNFESGVLTYKASVETDLKASARNGQPHEKNGEHGHDSKRMKTECKTNRTMESSIEVVTLDSDEEQGAEGYEWPNTQPLYPPQNSIDEVSPPTYEHALLHSASNSLSAGVSPPEIQKTFVKKSEFSVPTNVFVPTKEPSVVCDPRLNPGLRREHSRVKVRGNRNGEHANKRPAGPSPSLLE